MRTARSVIADLPWPDRDELLGGAAGQPAGDRRHRPGRLRPLTLVDSDGGWLLYLDRYFQPGADHPARLLADRESSRPDSRCRRGRVPRLASCSPTRARRPRRRTGSGSPPRVAATEWTTILTGGPGTGKTHTVARILALLYRLHGPGCGSRCAAPTGKAAAPLTEAVAAQAAALGFPRRRPRRRCTGCSGWRRGSTTRFRHDARNRLPYDVVVVDETSMVSLTMMARLLEALRPQTRLILMGDPDQLTSVDAGAVLADLVNRARNRSDNPALQAIVSGRPRGDAAGRRAAAGRPGTQRSWRAAWCGCARGRRFNERHRAPRRRGARRRCRRRTRRAHRRWRGGVAGRSRATSTPLRDDVVAAGTRPGRRCARRATSAAALAALRRHRLLCAHREGPFGRAHWADSGAGLDGRGARPATSTRPGSTPVSHCWSPPTTTTPGCSTATSVSWWPPTAG